MQDKHALNWEGMIVQCKLQLCCLIVIESLVNIANSDNMILLGVTVFTFASFTSTAKFMCVYGIAYKIMYVRVRKIFLYYARECAYLHH